MLVDADLMALLQRTSAGITVDVAADVPRSIQTTHRGRSPSGPGAMVSWGPDRFVNRAIGASLDNLGDDDLDRFEAFYDAAGAPPSIEVLSWASPMFVTRLVARGSPRSASSTSSSSRRRDREMPAGVTVRSVDDARTTSGESAFVEGFATAGGRATQP